MMDLQKDSITRGIKAESERCIGETECYFNLKNQIEQLQAENALLRKVVEVAREFFEGTGCEPKECNKCDPKYINFCERSGIGRVLAELDKEGEK